MNNYIKDQHVIVIGMDGMSLYIIIFDSHLEVFTCNWLQSHSTVYFKIHMQTQHLEQKGKLGLHAMLIPKEKLVNNSQKWLQSTEERRQLASRIRMSAPDCWDKLLLCLYLPPPVINLRLLLLQ
jgi:hypothetical protein